MKLPTKTRKNLIVKHKLIIRQCRIELLCAEHDLDEERLDKATNHLDKIYRFIHYGGMTAGYENKDKIHPPKH